MKISVALATYNGARYLDEQLDSIAAQTRLPDELVLCDDCSQDETVKIAEEFRRRAPFEVRIHRQPQNVRSTKNFETAVELCAGDAIALCDQDDVWRKDKLSRLEAALSADESIGLVFSDAAVVDENLNPLGSTLWNCVGLTPARQRKIRKGQAFDILMESTLVTGATMLFRASYKPLLVPFPADILWIHDAWIATMIAAVSSLDYVAEPLISYRQHPAQQLGAVNHSPGISLNDPQLAERKNEHYIKHLKQIEVVEQRLRDQGVNFNPQRVQQLVPRLHAQKKHLHNRLALPHSRLRKAPLVLAELLSGRYHRFSNGWRSAGADFILEKDL